MYEEDELGVDEFLGHKTSGGGATVLTGWKQSDSHSVDVWHHTKAPIAVSVWYHRAPDVIDIPNKSTGGTDNKTISIRLGCWEPEANLKVQYKRDRETGVRLNPPERCGQCKFVEWTRTEVMEERLNWMEPVFKFQGADDEGPTIVRAGHIYNGFGGDQERFSEEEREEMRKYKVSPKFAWKLNYYPKANYIFRVVDNDHPEKGVQVTIEPALLGDKVKSVIAEMREKWGVDDGNPLKRPYAFRWKNLPDEKEFNKRYKATALTEGKLKVDITPEIHRLITATDAPDVSAFKRHFNMLSWRARMEAACLIDVPWDELYALPEGYDGSEEGTDFDPAKLSGEKPKGKVQGQVPAKAKSPPPPEPEQEAGEEEEFACDDDNCTGVMKATDRECPVCHKRYDVGEEEKKPEPPPPPPRKKRSEMGKPTPAEAAMAKSLTDSAERVGRAAAKASSSPAKGSAPVGQGTGPKAAPKPATGQASGKATVRRAPPPPLPEPEPEGNDAGQDDDIPF